MPTIRFVKNLPEIQVEVGAPLMATLLAAGLPVASSCHGDGVCAKCRVQVVSGMENLSAIEPLERILKDRLKISTNQRISCQTRIHGDILIDTSYW